MYLVRLMWRSASESKPVHSRYSRLSQVWRTAEPIRIISAVSNWFRRRTSNELNSLNSIRLMWSTASEPGLRRKKIFHREPQHLISNKNKYTVIYLCPCVFLNREGGLHFRILSHLPLCNDAPITSQVSSRRGGILRFLLFFSPPMRVNS